MADVDQASVNLVDPASIQEARKAFTEAVSQTNRYLVTTLSILVILGLVVDLEIREFHHESDTLRGERNGVKARIFAIREKLKGRFLEIRHNAPRLEIPTIDFTLLPSPQNPVRDVGSRLLVSQKTASFLESLRTVRPMATGTVAKELASLIQLTESYRGYFLRLADEEDSLARIEGDIRTLERRRPSIPTPFGNFEVKPALALVALTVASFLSYFGFLAGVARVRGSADEYLSLVGAATSRAGPLQMPLWLFPNSVGRSAGSGWLWKFSGLLLPSMIHAVWVGLVSCLAWESLRRWNLDAQVGLGAEWLWTTILLSGTLATWVLAIGSIAPVQRLAKQWAKKAADQQSVSWSKSRRAILRFGLLVGIVALIGGISMSRYLRPRNRRQPIYLRPSEIGEAFDPAEWVGHSKSKRLHHRQVCRLHLPSGRFKQAVDLKEREWPVHPLMESRILEYLGNTRTQPDEALRLHGLAAKWSPLSIHLYDAMLRDLARLRQFDRMAPMLEVAISSVETTGAGANVTRAVAALKTRLRRTELRGLNRKNQT